MFLTHFKGITMEVQVAGEVIGKYIVWIAVILLGYNFGKGWFIKRKKSKEVKQNGF